MSTPVLELRAATKRFEGRALRRRHRTVTYAVREVSLTVHPAEILALVGESGAGKSTAGRLALGLETADDGEVCFEGTSFAGLSHHELRQLRRRTHLILQDPYQALHPGMRVETIIGEGLDDSGVSREVREQRTVEALEEVQLTPASQVLSSYPHELSGGQRQRVAFARALVGNPALVVADEPVSMLDVSLQAGILALIEDMRAQHDIAFLFVTHDLAVARHVADRIAVMYGGRLLEIGPAEQVVHHPHHPYTEALLEAVEHIAAPEEPAGPFPPGGQPCERHGGCQPESQPCRDARLTHVPAGPGHSYARHLLDRDDT